MVLMKSVEDLQSYLWVNENCTSLSLDYDWKIWDFWPKYKIGFILKVFNIAVWFFEKNLVS